MCNITGRARNAHIETPKLDPKVLFSAMAYDLKVHQEKTVIAASALLHNGKYLSFLRTLDEWMSQSYTSIDEVVPRLHQLAALFVKFPFEDDTIDREKVAMDKFRRSEHMCMRMNQKFRARRGRVEPPHMQFMRGWIENLIGREPNYEAIFSMCDFGPGSSVGTTGAQTSFNKKLANLTSTPAAEPVALTAMLRNRHYVDILLTGAGLPRSAETLKQCIQVEYVQYNKIVCVPKNAKTHRTIAIEPALNGFIQKGIDMYLRRKLIRVGINLSDQGKNQNLAYLGSLSGDYATIDLSAASDSISIELVKELLPPEWFILLNRTRSPSYSYGSEITRYHKFCSMGNGFCFPLETLIFSAACAYAMSVASKPTDRFAVYGDDLIVPQGSALLLLETLRDLGFRHNVDKTFIFGGFRESCGADFFNGVNVRPIYVKSEIKMDHTVYPLLNTLRRKQFLRSWHTLFEALPARFRYLRPYPRPDDSAIDVPMDLFMGSKHAKWNRDTQSWNWKGIISKPTRGAKPRDDWELIAGKLRGDLELGYFTARFGEDTRVATKT